MMHAPPWSPVQLVLGGRFADSDDLSRAVKELSEACGDPVIVATFSAHYLLPTLSRVHGLGSPEASARLLRELKDELSSTLRQDGYQAVIRGCTDAFTERHGTAPAHTLFGTSVDRPGELMVAVFTTSALEEGDSARLAEYVALCALGSRNAAFHRENAIDLSTARRVREASGLIDVGAEPASVDELADIAQSLEEMQTANLLTLILETLSAEAIVTYEAGRAELMRHHVMGEVPDDLAPLRMTLEDVEMPWIAGHGVPLFATLGDLVNVCVLKERRLVGTLGVDWWCVCSPFGAEHIGSGPAGAVCIVFRGVSEEKFGSYELSLLRLLATHFSRASAERRWMSAVGFVSTHLNEISSLGSRDSAAALVGCSPELLGREDVTLASPIISDVLSDIADLSNAMSVTCRLIAGADGPLFSRRLFRLHCVGGACAISSPDSLSADDVANSVNAWVAVNGTAVYLRSLVEVDGPEPYMTSPDMARYPGLARVAKFRESVRSELCVPIFAEDKLVGTINLEAESDFAFDRVAAVVDECAQLIGVALLESRRQISVTTMTEARGFLGRRHELENRLINFGDDLASVLQSNADAREMASSQIQSLRSIVYMRQTVQVRGAGANVTVDEVLRHATASIEWTYKSLLPLAFASNVETFIPLSSTPLANEPAEALFFAVTQALLNVRKYGSKAYTLADWEWPVSYDLKVRRLGGRDTLYLAIRSVCYRRDISDLQYNRVFREPIDHPESGRTSLGAFLAGEVLRRSGGSAYFRVDSSDEFGNTLRLVTAEFGIPTFRPTAV